MAVTATWSASNHILASPQVIGSAPVTMASWFYSTSATASQTIAGLFAPTNNNYLVLTAAGSTGGDPVQFYITGGGGGFVSVNTSTGYSTNTWTHACGVCASATERRVYINGGSKGTSTTSRDPQNIDRNLIGLYKSGAASADPFIGNLAEVAFWSAALTDDEVYSLSRGISPRAIRPQSLVSYLPLVRSALDTKNAGWSVVGSISPADHPRIYR